MPDIYEHETAQVLARWKLEQLTLITDDLNALPPLFAQDKKGNNAVAFARFHSRVNGWTWYATEYDPETHECFGLVKGFETELGYFSLQEMQDLNMERQLPYVTRTRNFQPITLREARLRDETELSYAHN